MCSFNAILVNEATTVTLFIDLQHCDIFSHEVVKSLSWFDKNLTLTLSKQCPKWKFRKNFGVFLFSSYASSDVMVCVITPMQKTAFLRL